MGEAFTLAYRRYITMKIKKLHLKNGYKRFFDLTIDLGEEPKRIVALVGPNGSGKSSVLDGILFHANAYEMVGDKGRKDHTFHSMNATPDFNHLNVEIIFDQGNFDLVRERRGEGRKNSMISFRSPYRYNNNVKINESRAVGEIRLNNYGASTSSDLDDKMEQNYRRLQIKYNEYLNNNDSRPSEAKAVIIGELNASITKCLDLEIDHLGNIESGKGTIYFRKKDQPIEFEFNVLSSGEKEVVDLLLDLYLRMDEFNDSIFLIDEPELHINTSIQRKLLVEIDKLVGENCQIWVATHSVGFLRALQEELKDNCQIIEFKQGTNWASELITLNPIAPTRSNWSSIFSTALDDLTNLVAPKRLIYCEGRDNPGLNGKEKGFDAQVYNTIFAEKYTDTQFISSGGNTELDQRSGIAIAILTKVFAEMEIWVLKDRDMASGKIVDEAARQNYLTNNPAFHRVLKRYEIENYLFDKEILKKYCTKHSLVFKEQEYDAFVPDIINDNIKNSSNHIRNFCSIVAPINPEIFKKNLAELITAETSVYAEFQDCIFNRN